MWHENSENAWFALKSMILLEKHQISWKSSISAVFVSHLSAYNSTKLFVWSIQNVLLVTRKALAHRLHPLGPRHTSPQHQIVSGKTRFLMLTLFRGWRKSVYIGNPLMFWNPDHNHYNSKVHRRRQASIIMRPNPRQRLHHSKTR